MASIRVCVPQDIPAVVELFGRVYPAHRWRTAAACEQYFREILFETPWQHLALPSWVAEEPGGVVGFLGILPHPMTFQGRPLRAAICTQLIVDPSRSGSILALQMLQACLEGPQDLTFADGENDEARRLCVAAGMEVPLLFCEHWTRPLRPARCALALLGERRTLPAPLRAAALPAAALADLLASRLRQNRFYRDADANANDGIDARTMLAHLPEMMRGVALQPQYDEGSLDWLLMQAARKTRHGRLRMRGVRDAATDTKGGLLLGWYVYYLQPGAIGEVLQVAARAGSYDYVLQRLLADAWRHGALALRGRVDPRYLPELSQRHCWFRREGTWTVAHSRDPQIVAALHRGDAVLSRLDGEWWLRYEGEPLPASPEAPADDDADETLLEHVV
jgi:hypothetical protein